MALTGANTAEKIWNYLMEIIVNEYGVAALIGNLDAESGLKTTNLQDSTESRLNHTDATYTAAVDSGKYTNFVHDSAGYGLAQWTYWSRKQGLLDYVRSAGKSIGDLECQLIYLAKELSTNYKSVLNALKTATSIRTASDVVLKDFEKPKDQSESVKKRRAEKGQKYFDLYSKGKVNSMSVRVGSARSNENGGINGGAAGDQTGGEVATQAWYLHSKGWVVLRAKDAAVREKIAHNMESICANDNIGYCQDHRATLTSAAKPYGYDASKVTQKVEVDCSEAVRNCLLYAGITVASFSTATEASALVATGAFEKLTDSKYCNSSDYLLRGDILVTKTKGHTVIVLDNGVKAGSEASGAGTSTRYKVGDVVSFTGTKHYTSANVTNPKTCKPGKAKVTAIAAGAKHPYHLVHTDSTSTVYGWVDAADIGVMGLNSGAASTKTHTVVKGDTLSAIASKYGATIAKIVEANKSKYPKITANYIVVGWTISIPQ